MLCSYRKIDLVKFEVMLHKEGCLVMPQSTYMNRSRIECIFQN